MENEKIVPDEQTNAAVDAMEMLQNEMIGEAARAGLEAEENINEFVSEVRKEVECL